MPIRNSIHPFHGTGMVSSFFRKFSEIINKAVGEYNEKTGKFVRDHKTLDEVLTAHGVTRRN
ncbi:MAG: hypothetical protein R2681_05010 [Pyrinomonadaceae bacterium]